MLNQVGVCIKMLNIDQNSLEKDKADKSNNKNSNSDGPQLGNKFR
jgi:hypothetical protein